MSLLLLILGAGIFLFGTYKSDEVSQKEQTLTQMETQADESRRPILGPVRRNIRDSQKQSAEEKIGDAKSTIAGVGVTAAWMQGIGTGIFVIGFGWAVFSFSRKI